LKEKEEKRDEALWELALDLTDKLMFFVDKLRVVKY
jgi:hypothetical protein